MSGKYKSIDVSMCDKYCDRYVFECV
jgi:hypothetical protein